MFYEVRIFDAKGQLKKTISSNRLSNRFWKKNENAAPDYSNTYNEHDLEDIKNKRSFKSRILSRDDSAFD